jgi:mannose-1-phosphate guanylyltransferase/mannose-6-phosphate isomerase
MGDVYTHDTSNALLISQHRLLAAVGVDNIAVIETPDAVLVTRKDCAQDVKEIVNRLKADARSEYQFHRRVFRPWGSYEGLDAGERFQVKRLTVNPGAILSLQLHHHRAEHWVVVKGTARVTRGDEVFTLNENESTYIPVGTKHRLENPGTTPLEVIEVQSGGYLGEDDIVRFEDKYNRHTSGDQ